MEVGWVNKIFIELTKSKNRHKSKPNIKPRGSACFETVSRRKREQLEGPSEGNETPGVAHYNYKFKSRVTGGFIPKRKMSNELIKKNNLKLISQPLWDKLIKIIQPNYDPKSQINPSNDNKKSLVELEALEPKILNIKTSSRKSRTGNSKRRLKVRFTVKWSNILYGV